MRYEIPQYEEVNDLFHGILDRNYNHIDYKFVESEVSTDRWLRWAADRRRDEAEAMPVSLINGSTSIWGQSYLNGIGRAWHDCVHFDTHLLFDHQSELRVAEHQMKEAERFGVSENLLRTLEADTYGMTLYHLLTGTFPNSQRAFILEYVETGMSTFLAGRRV